MIAMALALLVIVVCTGLLALHPLAKRCPNLFGQVPDE